MTVHKGVGHYGAPITLDQAKKAMAAAEAEAKKNNWNVAIYIVDSGGHVVMVQRLDGTQLASIRIAEGKARTAVSPANKGAGGRDCGRRRGIAVFHRARGQSDGRRRPDRGRRQDCRRHRRVGRGFEGRRPDRTGGRRRRQVNARKPRPCALAVDSRNGTSAMILPKSESEPARIVLPRSTTT
jgi:Haem degrading protein HbpS-like